MQNTAFPYVTSFGSCTNSYLLTFHVDTVFWIDTRINASGLRTRSYTAEQDRGLCYRQIRLGSEFCAADKHSSTGGLERRSNVIGISVRFDTFEDETRLNNNLSCTKPAYLAVGRKSNLLLWELISFFFLQNLLIFRHILLTCI